MVRFAANLHFMFTEHAWLDRFEAAAAAGFRAVECPFPYDHDAATVAARVRAAGLAVVLQNFPPGDWGRGERGLACVAGREAEFRADVDRAVEYARAMGCARLNCLAGIPGGDRAQALDTLSANLRYAAPRLARAGIQLLLEPINTHDMPGYCVATVGQALEVLDRAAVDNTFLQFDVYHVQAMADPVLASLAAARGRIAHVQVADHPGRHEPGTGCIDFPAFFAALAQQTYAGWVGCEYQPAHTTMAGLGWLARWSANA
jgi:hydroxypyruvate isomerase